MQLWVSPHCAHGMVVALVVTEDIDGDVARKIQVLESRPQWYPGQRYRLHSRVDSALAFMYPDLVIVLLRYPAPLQIVSGM